MTDLTTQPSELKHLTNTERLLELAEYKYALDVMIRCQVVWDDQIQNKYLRKLLRTNYYYRFVYGWKLKKCISCNGSGVYDHNGTPPCGSCEGLGKERYKSELGYGEVKYKGPNFD